MNVGLAPRAPAKQDTLPKPTRGQLAARLARDLKAIEDQVGVTWPHTATIDVRLNATNGRGY